MPKSSDTSINQTSTPTKPNFSSEHSLTMSGLLNHFSASLLITTYQSGKLIIARAEREKQLNTHFSAFNKPMGLATQDNRFSVGVRNEIVDYQNVPASAPIADKHHPEKIEHSACFVPRFRDITGDIDIHEMAYDAQGKLWFVNTRFSCLCTQTLDYSFEPQWRPWFVDAYAPEDRCHLNGLAIRDGQARYVTALGQTNTLGGWRENKRDGGVIIDIQKNSIISDKLSMPHSPRWYNDTLWLLESGYGRLVKIDPNSGEKTIVATLPGFTRGLCFLGNIALIGLSKVRESNTFGGLPLTESDEERHCGVWAVDIHTGQNIGFLKFSGDVEEIFSVESLNTPFPAILDTHDTLVNTTYVLSDSALAEVKLNKSNPK